MKLGIDIDGVMGSFFEPFEELIVHITGRDLFSVRHTPENPPPVWNWPQACGYTNAEMEKVWDWIKQYPTFWGQENPYPGSMNLMSRLAFVHPPNVSDTYFITTRPGAGAKRETERWLKSTFKISNPAVLISQEKGAVAKGLQLDVFVEDNLDNALKVAWATEGACKTYLIDRPYNRPNGGALFMPPPGFVRVADLKELLEQEEFL